MRVKRAVIKDHWIIEGSNLDYLLDEDSSRALLVLDDLYSDLYSDYIFMGYNFYPIPISSEMTEVTNLHDALSILRHKKTITICGDDPRPCVALFSLLKTAEGEGELEEALSTVASEIAPLYSNSTKDVSVEVKGPLLMGVKALDLLSREMGTSKLDLLLAIARNYDFGKGEKVFNDRISWTVAADLPLSIAYAQLVRFLIEGHGSPEELLEVRLDALGGKEEVESVIGEEALNVLEKMAREEEDDDVKVMKLIDALNPGSSNIYFIERSDSRIVVKCKGKCNVDLRKISKLLPINKYGIESIEFVTL
ncbi:hypothetical protein EYM_04365 [Ignicoccus islandicus DSM 13165]|uniref:Uncharacterized protein n=1 Tax=Ignicoccus islandicus DSM 13165 TaxID=940295 RepID=A0A0U3F4K9_9CREN|nr:hypothetical protein [Ignicoccus islandicus]ALU12485.1 hypothetical protein EYM_04365 [Ignicoccus islandicus DSM 13165]